MLKTICATSIVLFSLLTLFTAAFAWFQLKSDEDLAQTVFKINSSSDLVSFNYDVYRYNFSTKQGYKTKGSSETDLSLNKYDSFIRERNANNNNILRFDITFGGINESSKFSRNISVLVNSLETAVGSSFNGGTSADKTGYKYNKNAETYICNNISNIIQFKSFVYSYTYLDGNTPVNKKLVTDSKYAFDETSEASIYAGAANYFKILSPKTFVANSSKVTTIEVGEQLSNAGQITSLVFYVEYNYNEELVQDFFENNEFFDNESLQEFDPDGKTIEFNSDILTITVKSETILWWRRSYSLVL